MKAFCHSCGEVHQVPFGSRERPPCLECGTPLSAPPRERKPLERKAMKRSQPERDWTLARAKVEAECACRFCGRRLNPEYLQACHVIGRERDAYDPVTLEPRPQPWVVEPDRIVPGCVDCHGPYDLHEIDLLGKLTLEEEVQAVRDARELRGSGIERARRRLWPGAYREHRVA